MKKKLLLLTVLLGSSVVVHAQWNTSGNNIYNTNTGSVTVGSAAAPYAINASAALFPSATPKLEISTGIGGTTPFSELITIRHPGATPDIVSRQLGIIFKLSSESSTYETDKMGGLLFESANAYANAPTMSLVTANVRRLTIAANGKIGIGTTTPAYQFHIYNSGASADFGFDSFNSNIYLGSRLYFGRSRGTSTSPLAVQDGDFLGFLDFYGHDGTTTQRSGQIIVQVDGTPSSGIVPGALRFTTAGTDGVNRERMRINAAGNVGVAATAPISIFQVNNGPYKFSAGSCPGADLNYGTSYIGFNAARIGSGNSANWTIEGDGGHNGGGVIYTDVAGNIYLSPIPSAGTATRTLTDLDIKSSITFRVAANGTTYAKAITVTTTGWPDYVFKKDYKLPSLSDLKAYIDQNKHLPEVPAASQVEKNGQNLGEMNKLLMKKVEELTLYLISEEQKNKTQQEQLNQLAEQVKLLTKQKTQ